MQEMEPRMFRSHKHGLVAGVLDMSFDPNKPFTTTVSKLMEKCDVIMICNTKYRYLHKGLQSIPGYRSKWDVTGFGDIIYINDRNKSDLEVEDIVIIKHGSGPIPSHDQRRAYNQVMDTIWRELRRAPIAHGVCRPTDTVWCPGLKDTWTDHAAVEACDWVELK